MIDAQKAYVEWVKEKDLETKAMLMAMTAQKFAEFDEDKHLTGKIQLFVRQAKYGK